MNMNRLRVITRFYDPESPIYVKLYFVLSTMLISALFLMLIWDIIIGECLQKIVVIGAGLVMFTVTTIVFVRFKNSDMGSVLVAILSSLLLLPALYFTSGGIYGSTPIWYTFSFLYIGMVLRGKRKTVLIVLMAASTVACYVLSLVFPEFVIPHTDKTMYLDVGASVIVVGIMMFLMAGFTQYIYKKENDVANARKIEIEKLNQAQNRFFAGMSHEIRTPINTIIGLNELNLRGDLPKELVDNSLNIQSASNMLLHLINDILDMSKIESGNMEINSSAYDVGKMLSDIVGMMWIRAKEKNLAFNVEVDPEMPAMMYGDEIKIRQIIINLLTNAIKYTKEGWVSLSIACRRSEASKAVVTYTVTDTGIGIKSENIPHLFSSFKRVDEENNRYIEGTGLGLSIVKEFVGLMGGRINVNSVYTKGSTFVVEIPQLIADEKRIEDIHLTHSYHTVDHKHYKQSFEAPKARVLIVDDNEANLKVESRLLAATRMHIDTASSGAEALEMTVKNKYHVILMDHLMPEMDGVECMHRIRTQIGGLCKDSGIAALTANAGGDEKMFYAKEGFDGYIVKPVTGAALEHELMRLLPPDLVRVNSDSAEEVGEYLSPVHTRRNKAPVIITSESVCDLPKRMTSKYDIPIIPYSVKTDEGIFYDDTETGTASLIRYMDNSGVASSLPPTKEEYTAFFAEQLVSANYVIHITMAKYSTEGYKNLTEAAKSFNNVIVVDSANLSSAMGLLVLQAAELARSDMPVDDIVKRLNVLKDKMKTTFIVDSPDHLAHVDRINRWVAAFSKAFMLHPLIHVSRSRIKTGGVYFGSREKVWKKYIRYSMRDYEFMDKKLLFVTYVGLRQTDLESIRDEIEKKYSFDEIIFQEACPAVAVNAGSGTFGLLYALK
ncbi:MAG: DegV family EDD domain-containing protein [Ruminiclostridium sp.]|nr:DegV family EDD domain-containing protein [Ruminiclostridium sp.]